MYVLFEGRIVSVPKSTTGSRRRQTRVRHRREPAAQPESRAPNRDT
jgi:hypothetical protein